MTEDERRPCSGCCVHEGVGATAWGVERLARHVRDRTSCDHAATVHANVSAFIGVAALVILAPGPDTALVTKNALVHGRRPALATSFGVVSGLAVWTVAAALGVAAVVRRRRSRSRRSSSSEPRT